MTRSPVEQFGPARLVVTDRLGGVSSPPWNWLNLADHVGDDPDDVSVNRQLVADQLGVRDTVVVQAEHGARVHRVVEIGPAPCGDGLITTEPGLALLALGADCLAAAVVSPDIAAIAVFHSGWRGVAANVAAATIEGLITLGADPGLAYVRLGPAICPACYEVSAQVRDEVASAAGSAAAETRTGRPAVDLVAGVKEQLCEIGVGSIRTGPRCTYQNPHLYSHRRDAVTGRHGVMAVIVP